MGEKLDKHLRKHTVILVGSYTILSVLWVVFSDQVVASSFGPEYRNRIQSYKGVFFVLATALFLMLLMGNKNRSIRELFVRSIDRLRTFQHTFEQAAVGIAHLSADEQWLRVNSRFCDMLGYSKQEIKKLTIADIVHPDDLAAGKAQDRELYTGQKDFYVMKKRYITKNGEVLNARITKSRINDKYEKFDYYIAIIEDISDEYKATKELKASLQQKELLIKEIHHRVKNNLGLISGLLELQYFESSDRETKKQLQQSMLRIKCMGLIHDSFYQSEQFSYVAFNEYLENFISNLKAVWDSVKLQELTVSAEPIHLNINQAVPLGLLLNELITNISFSETKKHFEEQYELILKKDNSVVHVIFKAWGADLNLTLNPDKSGSINTSIIYSLIKQLNADFKIDNEERLFIEVTFQKEDKSGPSQGISPHLIS